MEYLNRFKVEDKKYIYAIEGYYGNEHSISEKYCELVISMSLPK